MKQNVPVDIVAPLGGLNRRLSWQKGGQDVYSSPDLLNCSPENSGERRTCLATRHGVNKWAPNYATDKLGTIQALSQLSYLKKTSDSPDYPIDLWLDDFRAYPFTSTADQAVSALWTGASWGTTTAHVLVRPNQVTRKDPTSTDVAAVVGPVLTIDTTLEYDLEMLITPIAGQFGGTYTIYGQLDATTPDNTGDSVYAFVVMNSTGNTGTWGISAYQSSSSLFSATGALLFTAGVYNSGGTAIPGYAKPMVLRMRVTKNGSYSVVQVTLDGQQIYLTTTQIPYTTNTRFGFGLVPSDMDYTCAIGWYRCQYTSTATSEKDVRQLVGIQDGKVFLQQRVNGLKKYTQQYCNQTAQLEVAERGQKLFIADYGPPLVSGTDGVLSDLSITVRNRSLTGNVVTLTTSGSPALTNRFNVGERIGVALNPPDPVFDGSFVIATVTSNTITYAREYANVDPNGSPADIGAIIVAANALTSAASFASADKTQYAVEVINQTDATKTGVYYLAGVETNTLYFDQELGKTGDLVTFKVFRCPKVFDPITGLLSIWRTDPADVGPHSVILTRALSASTATLTLVRGLNAVAGDLITVASTPPSIVFDGTYSIISNVGTTVTYSRPFSGSITDTALTSNVATLTLDGPARFSIGDTVKVTIDSASVNDQTYAGNQTLTAVDNSNPAAGTISYALTHGNIASKPNPGTASLEIVAQKIYQVDRAGLNTNVARLHTVEANTLKVGNVITVALTPANPIFDGTHTIIAPLDTPGHFIRYSKSNPNIAGFDVSGTISLFSGTAAITPKNRKGFVPPDCKLLTRCQDRMELSSPSGNEGIYYKSRQGDPFDFDYGADPTDVQRAVAGTSGPAGIVPVPIRAVAPWVDDLEIYFSDAQTYVMTGEVAMNAQLHLLAPNIGCVGPRAWCYLPDGSIVTLARDGLWMFPKDARAVGSFNPPTSLSFEKMPLELTNLSSTLYAVSLAYDQIRRGIQIFVTPFVTRKTLSFFFDMQNKGFWPFVLPDDLSPLCALMYTSTDPLQSDVIMGCKDGYLRRFSAWAPNDDGTAFKSYTIIGPMKIGNSLRNGMIKSMSGTLSINSGDVKVTLSTATSEEQVLRFPSNSQSIIWKGLVLQRATSTGISDLHLADLGQGGQQPTFRPRLRGGAFAIKVEDNQSLPWSLEGIAVEVSDGGLQRML